MFQITILLLYLSAGAAFTASRLPKFAASSGMLLAMAFLFSATGILWHTFIIATIMLSPGGIAMSLGNAASFVGWQLALVAILGAIEPQLRGLAGGMLFLAAAAASATAPQFAGSTGPAMAWQLQAHILISLFAYGLLSLGAIVAIFALVQDSRLRAGQISSVNQLFAPLETNERLLYGIAAAGFLVLLIAVISGLTFVENLFTQHLVHKFALSLLALALFGVLLAGRQFAGWRGRRGVYLYLWGFAALCLAYFGSRFVLENVLGRTWG